MSAGSGVVGGDAADTAVGVEVLGAPHQIQSWIVARRDAVDLFLGVGRGVACCRYL